MQAFRRALAIEALRSPLQQFQLPPSRWLRLDLIPSFRGDIPKSAMFTCCSFNKFFVNEKYVSSLCSIFPRTFNLIYSHLHIRSGSKVYQCCRTSNRFSLHCVDLDYQAGFACWQVRTSSAFSLPIVAS